MKTSIYNILRLHSYTGMMVYCVRNVVAHGDAWEGKWRGNWRMEGVTSTLTPPRQVVYPALLMLMRTPRLPAVDWTDSPADLNGLVRLGGRQNVVSARVPSGSTRAYNRSLPYLRPTKSRNVRFRNTFGAFASFPQNISKLLSLRGA